METLLADLRYALRTLRKSKGFALVCVLTLGLGIGASAAIFSVVNGVLLRPLPYPNHDRLVRVEETHPGVEFPGALWGANATYATFNDMARETQTIENVSAYRPWSFNLTGDGEPEQVAGALVSEKFFAALGSKPLLGRMIVREDDAPGGDNYVVVLSYALWKRRYGADQTIVGKLLRISAEDYHVIGVMPRGFDYPDKSEVWCPLVPLGQLRANRRAHLLTVIANPHGSNGIGAVQGELASLAAQIERQNPGVDSDMHISAVSLKNSLVAPLQPALVVLAFAVGLLLLISCANLANLLLARAAAREKEFSLRAALGARRARLARQSFTESLVIALLGGLLGLALAAWSLRFISALDSQDLPRFGEITLDWSVLGFTVLIACLSGLLFGSLPALFGARADVNAALKEGATAALGANRANKSRALVVPQFALAVVLLVGAGLLGNSFVRLLHVNPGFQPHGLLAAELFLSPTEYPEGDARGALMLQQMVERVKALPGVRSAGLVTALPITGGANTSFVIDGRPPLGENDEPSADIRSCDVGYFRTMGIPLLAGREFNDSDNSTAARVMVINETMARRFWPNENPVGRHVTMKDWGPPLTGEIIGIVGDVKTNGLDEAVGPMIYWPTFQFPQLFNVIVLRSNDEPLRLLPSVKAAIWSINKNQPVSKIETLEEVLSESLARRRLYMTLLGVFAVAALLLAGVGLYGMIAYSVSQRMREIGLRMAVGAAKRDILRLVLGQGARVALLGIVFGIAAALALTRLMASLLFGVTAMDPLTFVGVALLLLIVAVCASLLPARRAMRVDPLVALRIE